MLTVRISNTGNICEATGDTRGYNWWTVKSGRKHDFTAIPPLSLDFYRKVGTIPEELL